ncbi:MAG: endonuclease/exonuclease/phosphatase family protein [Phycisphaeraceae bacterium]|nr:endonuclease/exonuclease/phosphatase family protein [Phycisphaeraceae bacterium]
MLLVYWNILHGGGPARLPEIALHLASLGADVVILGEFRAARGGQLRAVLADLGLEHQVSQHAPGRANGLLLASRWALEPHPTLHAGRLIDAHLPGQGLWVTGVHLSDDAHRTQKAAQWLALIELARLRRAVPHVIIGDFNTARPGQDSGGVRFACAQRLGVLASLGYTDAWRHAQGEGAHEATWRGTHGQGARIDAAHVSPPLLSRVRGAWHGGTHDGAPLSDHALVALRLDPLSAPHG